MKLFAVDAHCHLVDPRFPDPLKIVQNAQAMGIKYLMMGGVDPQDWDAQLLLCKNTHGVFPVLGIHPYRVAHWNSKDLDLAWGELESLVSESFAIGETGIDARSEFSEQLDGQDEFFRRHIELAIKENKVLVTHIVRSHNDSLRVLKEYSLSRPVIVHAFNSGPEIARQYTELGFYLSVGGAVTFERNKKLQEAIKTMPRKQLLIESDSPDQKPCGWSEVHNKPESIFQVADSISKIWGESAEEVLHQTSKNFQELFAQEFRKPFI